MKPIITRRPQHMAADLGNTHPVLKRIYAARGIATQQQLERGLERLLPYQQMLNIDIAAQCLVEALRLQQRIVIIGDFDADGATSTALAVAALRAMGAKEVDYLVPNRFEYGYGLTPEIVAVAAKQQPAWIITVDNGIASCAGVAAANALGMQVIITDHHLPGDELPAAKAIVNPNQVGDEFPSKNLAGVGVIFYLMLALRNHLRSIQWFEQQGIPEPNMAHFLDLVALGTIADLVPLDHNNRILVYQGLQRIRAGKCRPGILALLALAKRQYRRVNANDLSFAVAPRLNAAGRLNDMSLGIACLLATDPGQAQSMASTLDSLNEERRAIESEMQQQALDALAKLNLQNNPKVPAGLCLFNETWHQGVIGILAARIKERTHRPVIVFALANEHELKGSARSIPGLHIRDVLAAVATRHPTLITHFGGHAMAAGLTLPRQHYQEFCAAYAAEVQRCIDPQQLRNELHSDGELTVEELNLPLAESIREAGPWGQLFPEPLFDGKFRLVEQRLVGGKHLKLVLGLEGSLVDAIAFNIDVNQWPNHRAEYAYAAYKLDVNEYRGLRNLQLQIEHIEAV